MSNDSLGMYEDFSKMLHDENSISGNSVLEVLKKYSSTISVFDMMEFTSRVIEENRYVQESYRKTVKNHILNLF